MDHQTKHPQPVDQEQAEFMVGAIIGAMAGAAAALLLTPKNGKEMRAIVKEYAKEWEAEAYELAKESHGVTKSLRQALDESTSNLVEAAPHTIEEATQHAQHFANALEQHIESARDTVSEIAEAFRSGWEEYGEELIPADQLSASTTSSKLDLPDVLLAPTEDVSYDTEDEDRDDQPSHPHRVSHGRRRSGSHHYAMHSSHAPKDHEEQPEPKVTHRPLLASEEIVEAPTTKSHYTTRVLEQATPTRQAKTDHKDDKPAVKKATKDEQVEDKTKSDHDTKQTKKLFFRRGS